MTRTVVSICIWGILFNTIAAQQSYDITFTHADKTVYGTFATPDGPGPFPTIIINPGSGANDRDGTLLMFGGNIACLYPDLVLQTLKPYRDMSDALVDSGYAVLRYDKLEFTYPTNLGTITFHKLWLPVESAIGYVKTREDVDTNRIILIGHSEGSTLIPIIAKDRNDIKALISIAGPRSPLDSLLAYQLVHIARTCEGDTNLAKTQAAQILAYFNTIRTNTWNAGTPPFAGVQASVWYDYVTATDPVTENYNTVGLPSLFLGLGLDINVPLSELERLQQDITITDDFWSIPDLIHFMTPADDPHVSEILTDTIIYWLRQQGLATSVQNARPGADFNISVTPNPFSENLTCTIHSETSGKFTFTLTDTSGAVVFESAREMSYGEEKVSYNLGFLPAGTYAITASSGYHSQSLTVVKQ